MTQLLVLSGILSQEIMEMVKKNQGVSIYLYDTNFLYGTLWAAYKNAKEESSFSHIRRLLLGMDGWDETVVKHAFLGSNDYYDFIHSLPCKMAMLLLRNDWMDSVLESLFQTNGRAYVVSSMDGDLSQRLQKYPVLTFANGFPEVGEKTIFVTTGSAKRVKPIGNVSHILVGPGATSEQIKDLTHTQEHHPVVITAEQVIAEGGCKKFYL